MLCALLALLIPCRLLSLLFAAPLAFFLPGYAIVAATFARRNLGWPRSCSCSASALSLAMLALGALVLNYVPGGIRASSWAILLLLVVARLLPRRGACGLPRSPPGAPCRGRASVAATAAVSAPAAAGRRRRGGAGDYEPLPADKARGYTELWVDAERRSRAGVPIGVGSERAARRPPTCCAREFGRARAPDRAPLRPRAGRRARMLELTRRRRRRAGRCRSGQRRSPRRQPRPGPYRRVSAWIPARRRGERADGRRRARGRHRHRQLQLRPLPRRGDRERPAPRPTERLG